MKRICIQDTNMSSPGGLQRVISLISNGLILFGDYEIFILSINNPTGISFFPLDEKIKHICLKRDWDGSFLSNWYSYTKAIKLFLKKNSIDILISCDNIGNLYSIPAVILSKTKLYNWDHFNSKETLGSFLMQPMRFFTSLFCDKYICLTKKDKDVLGKKYPWIRSKLFQIYNPALVDNPDSLCYNSESKLILTAGHLIPIKGYDMLIHVADVVFKFHPEWKWVICGEGPLRHDLQIKINKLNLEHNIVLLGSVKKMDEQYQNAGIYVMTSRSEGFPMTLLEAQAAKLPIVAFDIFSGPSEIINNDKNGFLIPDFDTNKMANKILKLIDNNNVRCMFSSDAYLSVQKFSIDEILKQWRQIL